MKTKFLLTAFALPAIFAACSNEELVETSVNQQPDQEVVGYNLISSGLSINVSSPVNSRLTADGAWTLSDKLGLGWLNANPDCISANQAGGTNTSDQTLYANNMFQKESEDGQFTTYGNITGLKANNGLFSTIATLGSIKNIIFECATINATGNHVGILAGNTWVRGNIENITVIDSYVKGQYNVGALIGLNNEGNVKNCTVNNSVVEGVGRTGGITGRANGYANDKSQNYEGNKVLGSTINAGSQVGAICGNVNYIAHDTFKFTISNSTVTDTNPSNHIGTGTYTEI